MNRYHANIQIRLYKWIACHEWGNIKINSTISVGIPKAGTDLFQLHRIVHFIFRSLSIPKLKFIALRVVFDERSCAGTQFYRYRSNEQFSITRQIDLAEWKNSNRAQQSFNYSLWIFFMCYELTMCTTLFLASLGCALHFLVKNFHFSGLLKAQLVFVFFFTFALLYIAPAISVATTMRHTIHKYPRQKWINKYLKAFCKQAILTWNGE